MPAHSPQRGTLRILTRIPDSLGLTGGVKRWRRHFGDILCLPSIANYATKRGLEIIEIGRPRVIETITSITYLINNGYLDLEARHEGETDPAAKAFSPT